MRALIQRVKEAKVTVGEKITGQIGKGMLIFFAVHKNDTLEKNTYLANKILHLRIFPNEKGQMDQDIKAFDGQILVVSQFTLYGNCMKGRRPDFTDAATPETALFLYEKFIEQLKALFGKSIETGIFGAKMEVQLVNDGPVTLLIEK